MAPSSVCVYIYGCSVHWIWLDMREIQNPSSCVICLTASHCLLCLLCSGGDSNLFVRLYVSPLHLRSEAMREQTLHLWHASFDRVLRGLLEGQSDSRVDSAFVCVYHREVSRGHLSIVPSSLPQSLLCYSPLPLSSGISGGDAWETMTSPF